jgi:putative restriction endonuclease
MAVRSGWSRKQLLVAFKLYCQLPFGKFHHGNPEIIRCASTIGRTPSALAMKLSNIASLDPEITGTGRRGLTGASAADKAMWAEMHKDWKSFADQVESAAQALGVDDLQDETDLPGRMPELPASFVGTTRQVKSDARVGQDFFRKCVLSAYSARCCISGLAVPQLLVASHIASWKDDPNNRLNPRNGLCLSALHDKAFDSKLIYLNEHLEVKLSRMLARKKLDSFTQTAIASYEGHQIAIPEKFAPDLALVKQHRELALRHRP